MRAGGEGEVSDRGPAILQVNTYDRWGLKEYEQYVRDLVIWGTNGIELIPLDPDGDFGKSLTFNAQLGLPPLDATFPSVRLCELNTATGLPNLAAPLFQIAPFVGSPNGANEIPVGVTINDPDKVRAGRPLAAPAMVA